MTTGPVSERNQDATIYVGGLDEKVTEPLLWELFVQAGPVVNVHMPKDRITMQHQGYGFIEFLGEEDADYACKIMNMIKLYGKPIRVNKASAHQKNLDIGANIFIGNLDPEVDEKLLYDTFSAFGVILQTPKIMRDPTTGNSKGFAFINFASFEASDAAIEAMNGQYLCNRPITISYAFKKDSKGERHGSAAERLLAAQNPLAQSDRPHQLFADAPPIPPMPMMVIHCPVCREPTQLNGGVDKLKTNPYTLQFGIMARKKQVEVKQSSPILWCMKCGKLAGGDCNLTHRTISLDAKERAVFEKLNDYVSQTRQNWAEAVLEHRQLNSVLESVSASLKSVKDKIDALMEENSSQMAIKESLIDEIELFGSDPTEPMESTKYMEIFRKSAQESCSLLSEVKNRFSQLNMLNSWSFTATHKVFAELNPVPFQFSYDTKDPCTTVAAFIMTQLLPKKLNEAATPYDSPGQSQGAGSTAVTSPEDSVTGGRFIEVAKAKKRPENYATATSHSEGNAVPKPFYKKSSCCFLEIGVNGENLGRIVVLLETDYAPTMCRTFWQACRPGSKINYRGTRIFQAAKDEYITGGGNGDTGIELYIPDKSTLRDERGAIRMRRRDAPNKQVLAGTEFNIILSKGPHRQYPITTVFGRIVEGLELCDRLSGMNLHKKRVLITDCGPL
nr:EOG090X0BVS [Eulimnadia texana]